MNKAKILFFLMGYFWVYQTISQEKEIKIYFIGNSLVRGLSLERMHELLSQRGIRLIYGSQLGAGISLYEHYTQRRGYDGQTFKVNNIENVPFGAYEEAFQHRQADALVLQPYRWSLHSVPHFKTQQVCMGDVESFESFIRYALGANPKKNLFTTTFYVYETWPRLNGVMRRRYDPNGDGVYSIAEFYESPYEENLSSSMIENTVPNREFTARLMNELKTRFKGDKCIVRLIPVGEVFAKLDLEIRAHRLPELETYLKRNQEYYLRSREKEPNFPFQGIYQEQYGVMNLYCDLVHMNDRPHNGPEDGTLGAYIAALTVISVITALPPGELSPIPYPRIHPQEDQVLIQKISSLIWKVVQENPWTEVKERLRIETP